jgi:hypothetical protein
LWLACTDLNPHQIGCDKQYKTLNATTDKIKEEEKHQTIVLRMRCYDLVFDETFLVFFFS